MKPKILSHLSVLTCKDVRIAIIIQQQSESMIAGQHQNIQFGKYLNMVQCQGPIK